MKQHTREFIENVMANIVGNSITDGDKLDYLRALLISIVELHEKVDKLTEMVKEVKDGNIITGND